MNEALESRLAQARESLEAYRSLRAELPRVQERLTAEGHRLHRVEARLEEVEFQLRALESFTLTGLIESLRGRKQGQLDERRTELGILEGQLEEAQSAFDVLHEQVQGIETLIAKHQSAEETYRAVCEEKFQVLLDLGGEAAGSLRTQADELESARARVRSARKAAESGRQLLQHLDSLARAVRNARTNRRMAGAVAGVVGVIVKHAVASLGPKSAVHYVVDGIKRFCRDLGELPLSDLPDDVELMRVRAELESFRASVSTQGSGIASWDQIATLPAHGQVQTALSHLKTWVRNAESTVTALEQQRYEWLERA